MSPMELIKKAFGVFKKQSAPPLKAADAPFEHDDNVVLVFGHSNAGKTVYFSVLYELLKGNADFKLSPLDNETAANLIENYNLMRGKLLRIKDGRQVEIEGERKFPTMTSETRILKFGLDMSVRKGIKFYTVDYKGETLSIAQPGELRKQFSKFFPFARAALFFLDASVLDTDVLLREQIAAFQTILHDLRDCVPKRLPVGVVITKADFLDGFSPANPVELVPSGAAVYKGRSKDSFISGLKKVNSRRFGEVWTKTTERIARTLGNLVDSVSAYTLDFQVFFVSATGGMGKTSTGAVEPPRDITSSGVADPLMWAFRRIMFNKRKAFWRYLVKWAFALSLIWVVGFSLFNVYHQLKLYGMLDDVTTGAEKKLADELRLSNGKFSDTQAKTIWQKYDSYLKKMPVSDFLGAKPLRDFVQERHNLIEAAQRAEEERVKQADAEAAKSGKIVKPSPKPTYADERTADAAKEFEELKNSLTTKPMAERQPGLVAGIAGLWQKYPKDTLAVLDPTFVKQVDDYPEVYKKSVADAESQTFTVILIVENIPEGSKVTIQIGTDDPVDFNNFKGDSPKVEKPVSGVGNASVVCKWVVPSSDTAPLVQPPIDNPMETMYPKLAEGYKLDFGRSYDIIVRLKPGSPPPPKLP